jgi:hypothetical protein
MKLGILFVLIALAAAAIPSSLWIGLRGDGDPAPVVSTAPAASPTPAVAKHPVEIRRETRVPKVDTGLRDADGTPIEVACGSCHATRPPEPANRRGEDLDRFHQHIEPAHGELNCLACHDERDYDALRLAGGESIAFPDRQQLCAQCHGTTARDYEHGAHGGMSGHWDLTRGPRQRLGCTDCHDPHAPAYPKMTRTFWPRDRFVDPPASEPGDGGKR